MGKAVAFTVSGSSSIYQLDIADTLVGFLEYDFTYFWEQCLELAHKSRLTGEYYSDYAMSLKEYIRTCHPYYNVLIRADFNKIALDCMIDFIFLSENAGLEELWARYISAKDSFGREVFERISEYKTGSAINQWANLLRMQEYAAAKAAFVFNGGLTSPKEYYARKQYFDLAFSLTAHEMGYRADELPEIRRYPVALLPEAVDTLPKATSALLPSIRPLVREKRTRTHKRKAGCMQDQAGGLVFNTMSSLERPGPIEMEAATDIFRELPSEVYLPSCMKAIIDLEFDKMLEDGLILQRKPDSKNYLIVSNFGRGSVTEAQVPPPQPPPPVEHIRRYMPPKISDLEPLVPVLQTDEPLVSDTKETAHVILPTPQATPPAEPLTVAATTKVPDVETAPTTVDAATPAVARPELVQQLTHDTTAPPSNKRSTQNINVRCQLIYTALYACVTNKTMSETEFEEWSHHLMSIRRSIIKRDMTVDDLERYLDATEQIYPQIAGTQN